MFRSLMRIRRGRHQQTASTRLLQAIDKSRNPEEAIRALQSESDLPATVYALLTGKAFSNLSTEKKLRLCSALVAQEIDLDVPPPEGSENAPLVQHMFLDRGHYPPEFLEGFLSLQSFDLYSFYKGDTLFTTACLLDKEEILLQHPGFNFDEEVRRNGSPFSRLHLIFANYGLFDEYAIKLHAFYYKHGIDLNTLDKDGYNILGSTAWDQPNRKDLANFYLKSGVSPIAGDNIKKTYLGIMIYDFLYSHPSEWTASINDWLDFLPAILEHCSKKAQTAWAENPLHLVVRSVETKHMPTLYKAIQLLSKKTVHSSSEQKTYDLRVPISFWWEQPNGNGLSPKKIMLASFIDKAQWRAPKYTRYDFSLEALMLRYEAQEGRIRSNTSPHHPCSNVWEEDTKRRVIQPFAKMYIEEQAQDGLSFYQMVKALIPGIQSFLEDKPIDGPLSDFLSAPLPLIQSGDPDHEPRLSPELLKLNRSIAFIGLLHEIDRQMRNYHRAYPQALSQEQVSDERNSIEALREFLLEDVARAIFNAAFAKQLPEAGFLQKRFNALRIPPSEALVEEQSSLEEEEQSEDSQTISAQMRQAIISLLQHIPGGRQDIPALLGPLPTVQALKTQFSSRVQAVYITLEAEQLKKEPGAHASDSDRSDNSPSLF